jgi:hypothetical protein
MRALRNTGSARCNRSVNRTAPSAGGVKGDPVMPQVQVRCFRSWEAFRKVVSGDEMKGWAFRGQASAEWPLYSSLSRYLLTYGVNQAVWSEQESRILRIFKRKAHLLLEHLPDEDDSFEWLALMQHHGAPTRLLDFTWSPFVARSLRLNVQPLRPRSGRCFLRASATAP